MNRSRRVRQPQTFMLSTDVMQECTTLPAVEGLFAALNDAGINYCHWKSNCRLDAALAGLTDLDLLVDPAQEAAFKRVLDAHDLKHLVAPPGKEYPGLEHYLGFDYRSGRLFHLHVHFALVLGEQHVKNYSLPIEMQFLDTAGLYRGVKVPPPELELIVLCVRALLKYRDRDVVKDVLSIRSPGIPTHIRDEVDWLLQKTTLEQVDQALDALPSFLSREVILEFLETIQTAPRAGHVFFRLRRSIRRALRPFQRASRFRAALRYFMQLVRKRWIQRSALERQMGLTGRGRLIALIGVDGAGKSTMAAELTDWLSWRIHVPFYYLGSKQPSVWTEWSYLLFRIARRGHRELCNLLGERHWLPRRLFRLRQTLLAAHYLFVGRDRHQRYLRAKEEVAAGAVVIFDRYPFTSPLDGPEIEFIDGGRLNPLTKRMARWERELYQAYEPVDLLILLEISPEAAQWRKPDHALATIRSKHAALAGVKAKLKLEAERWDWVCVDAGATPEEVSLEIKRSVWVAL